MNLSLLIVVGSALAVSAAEPAADSPETNGVPVTAALVAGFADEARARHPAVRAASARAAAAAANVGSVRTWEDPRFTFGGAVASSRGINMSEEGDLIYGLDQKLPLFGKAESQRHLAEAEGLAARAQAELAFQQVRRDIAMAAFRLARAEEELLLGAADLAALDALAVSAEQRYRAGTATQVEVLRAHSERARRNEQWRADTQRRDHAGASLNRLMNRDLTAGLPPLRLPGIAPAVPYTPRLVELALRFEPKIKSLRQEMNRAEAALQVSQRNRRPDLSVGVEGRQYSGDGGFRSGTFLVSLTLPWGNAKGYDSNVQREQERLSAATFDTADYELSVREEIHNLTVELDAARHAVLLNQDEQIPRAELALASAQSAWESNQGLFRDVLEGRRMLIDARLNRIGAIANQYLALSQLVLCCGLADLEALQNYLTQNPAPTEGDR